MSVLDDINSLKVDPALRDVLMMLHQRGIRRYDSTGWVRLQASATVTFQHGLFEIPTSVMVLDASDSQGSEEAVAEDIDVAKTSSLITVTDTSGTVNRFIRVRAL